ncbi:putative hydrolase or acyltransferase of alpha/beta superfamily [Acidovorax sp. CF316]|uniref:alpha/beta fold hydrolase n=1 Tax=Acidovorax sp. CF316 TaxID=1144317 RepID=UPI00026BE1CD|nr:alpha/beta hydrolase [Acidovorax sp. CF316]EJE52867.1 putative hydrolase or acyltransferase of alpha/beta superfamily [Acidovorax sp. CF316]
MQTDSMQVTRWGPAGPRVVMVHGSAQGSRLGGERHFVAQQQLAAQGWQVLVPDRPGHGRSPDPGRPDDAEADGALVATLMEGEEGAHLVGHSFGGCVALAAAASHPERVRSLTIIEPAMAALATDLPVVRRFLLQIVNVLFFSLSARSRIERFMRLANIPAEIGGRSSEEELQQMGRALRRMKLPNKKTLARQLAAVRQAGVPVLVVSGGWSPAFDAISDRVAEVAGGRRLVIASPHHFPQQVSQEFNQVLDSFMREADARRP